MEFTYSKHHDKPKIIGVSWGISENREFNDEIQWGYTGKLIGISLVIKTDG